MADSEKLHLAELMQKFDLDGNAIELPPDVAARMVRLLGQQGYTSAGGVMPGESLGDADDAVLRRQELASLKVDKEDAIAGPYVLGVSDDSDGSYYPRGVMLYVKRQSSAESI